ncbi:hypothetical protein O3P69_008214 [Scylla paramamosain]|uniref:Uncharacterized protein n=1 Tax=Scylla paramamosain TaxID=85552 RepID=A0AAW0T154_SCYPA
MNRPTQQQPALFSEPGQARSVSQLGFVVQNGVDGLSSAGSVITLHAATQPPHTLGLAEWVLPVPYLWQSWIVTGHCN